jgi:hypothetical protein
MQLKLELTQREIDALRAMSNQASIEAAAMIEKGKERGQMKLGYQIEEGVAILAEIINLAVGK